LQLCKSFSYYFADILLIFSVYINYSANPKLEVIYLIFVLCKR